MTRSAYDVAVIGAGPAGLAAATVAARAGLATVLFDEQPSPGGQIYRAVTDTPVKRGTVFGADYWSGAGLVRDFLASGAEYAPGATVWSLTREREIGVSQAGQSRLIRAERVIIATGALERPFPIPGWTLPGVMTAGAAQVLLKTAGLVAERTVLAGCGPLLWLLAAQYLDAGARLAAILDTTPRENWVPALRDLPDFLRSPYLAKGLRLIAAVRRRVRVISGVSELRAEGGERVDSVVYRAGGVERRISLDALLLHQGVVPNVNLAMSVGIAHRWDDVQLCWTPVLGLDGDSEVEGVAVAGDGAGIAGAGAAEARGRLAGLAAVRALRSEALGSGLPDAAAVRAELARQMRGRAFLDRLYVPAAQFRRPRGDTIVCRCEEVTADRIIETVALGCQGPNQVKAFVRCGMGPCQGRECGLTATELIAEARAVSPAAVGYYRLRPPVKPITLAEFAALPKDESALRSVARG